MLPACLLVLILVLSTMIVLGIAGMALQGIWLLIAHREWLWLAALGATGWTVRLIWRITTP